MIFSKTGRRALSRKGEQPLVIAHRGASYDAPENTLAALREAVRQEADGVEIDVRRCATGEFLLCHDAWMDRLAGEHLEVARTGFAVLRSLDVGRRFGGDFAGERMPALREVRGLLPPSMVLNIELKSEGRDELGLARAFVAELRRNDWGNPIIVSSFSVRLLAWIRLLSPLLPLAVLVGSSRRLYSMESFARLFRCEAVAVEHHLCGWEEGARWRAQGLSSIVWTVDEAADAERCYLAGVDALVTNRPAVLREQLSRSFTGARGAH